MQNIVLSVMKLLLIINQYYIRGKDMPQDKFYNLFVDTNNSLVQ